ncbi:hypothetical protein F8388_004681 [Cannabis sativa]|uniref:Uncharacterized protein n=1 Tax=Cannabis sativa TaxID=3483 RepID=A0A7J6H2K2_CANSA|nr:hypothetical protein G4B88_012629 [Cannabis sativa]KAF4396713.1 hypothetical protein F8388_004681 [Cannabis sativa]
MCVIAPEDKKVGGESSEKDQESINKLLSAGYLVE